MNVLELKTKIKKCRTILESIKSLSSVAEDQEFQMRVEQEHLSNNTPVAEIYEEGAKLMEKRFEELKQNLPTGFELDHNFIRHVGFNEVIDWMDIYTRDVNRELEKLNNYEKNLILVEKVEKLHPKVANTATLIMIGEYDAALTKIFKGIETEIRNKSGVKDKFGLSLVGHVFSSIGSNPPILQYRNPEKQESVKYFLMGVVGFYRNTIMHDDLPTEKSNIDDCFQQLVIASEAYKMIDFCVKGNENKKLPF
jgi:uncharacterized protein (TIGR02391 family)